MATINYVLSLNENLSTKLKTIYGASDMAKDLSIEEWAMRLAELEYIRKLEPGKR